MVREILKINLTVFLREQKVHSKEKYGLFDGLFDVSAIKASSVTLT